MANDYIIIRERKIIYIFENVPIKYENRSTLILNPNWNDAFFIIFTIYIDDYSIFIYCYVFLLLHILFLYTL